MAQVVDHLGYADARLNFPVTLPPVPTYPSSTTFRYAASNRGELCPILVAPPRHAPPVPTRPAHRPSVGPSNDPKNQQGDSSSGSRPTTPSSTRTNTPKARPTFLQHDASEYSLYKFSQYVLDVPIRAQASALVLCSPPAREVPDDVAIAQNHKSQQPNNDTSSSSTSTSGTHGHERRISSTARILKLAGSSTPGDDSDSQHTTIQARKPPLPDHWT